MTKLSYFGQQFTQDIYESVLVTPDPKFSNDFNLVTELQVTYEQRNFFSQSHILTVRALTSGITEAVPIPIKSKCIIPNLIGEPTLLKVIEKQKEVYVITNNNMLIDLEVVNQDNYLDEIPTVVSGKSVETPFWS